MDVAVVGAGPAGLFNAYELSKAGARVDLYDIGRRIQDRICPDYDCARCYFKDDCSILCGEGGAGGYSDGKLTLSVGRGVQLSDELNLAEYEPLIDYLEAVCLKLYPNSAYYNPIDRPKLLEGCSLGFESYPLRFYGTWGIRQLIANFHEELEHEGVRFRYRTKVTNVLPVRGGMEVVSVANGSLGSSALYDRVVLAAGSYDSRFMTRLAIQFGAALTYAGPAGFGIRLEAPDEFLEPIMSEFYDFKLYMPWELRAKGDVQYRSFCVNRGGKITNEYRPGPLVSINGRSEKPPTGLSNLAIMTKIPDAKDYVRGLARLLNDIGHGLPICQPTVGFMENDFHVDLAESSKPRHNSSWASLGVGLPKDLADGFREYIKQMDSFLPNLIESSVVYAPEIKYHMPRWTLDEGFVVRGVPRFQVVGNAAGYTDSISTAAVMGIAAAQHLVKNSD